ncbi:chromosome segregation protein SMC [Chloroflexota bacterium]
MPLRLKSLELHGYKTFASRMRFEFSERITAIVGPNGSGKSNIADALRWALGEQSYTILRGKKTEDMIFAGSDNRAPAGMASVALTFDNTNNWLPIDFSEVDLSRKAFRDGKNAYLINSQNVRLKDLNELLAQSGLSERTYSILGQGLVDASLALKADDRRRLFEEAAGIGLYRSRRTEALRRLEVTNRNLDRVLDILAELKPRLRSLEKQAGKASQYLQIQKDLKNTLLEWYGYHWSRSQKEMNKAREVLNEQTTKLESSRSEYQSIRNEYLTFRDKIHSLRSRLNSWHRESSQLHLNRELISREMAVLEERRIRLEENRIDSVLEMGRSEAETSDSRRRVREINDEIDRLRVDLEDAKEQLVKAKEILRSKREERDSLEEALVEGQTDRNNFFNQLKLISEQGIEFQTKFDAIQSELETNRNTIAGFEEEEEALTKDYSSVCDKREKLSNELADLGINREKIRKNIEKNRVERKEQSSDLGDLKEEKTRLKTQLEVLNQSEETFVGFTKGAKILLESSKKESFSSKIQAVSSVLDIPAKLEIAISAVLGDYVESLIFDSEQDVEQAIEILDSVSEGRVTILPLNKLVYENNSVLPSEGGVIGFASDLVAIQSIYKPVVDYLLNKFIVVEDRKTASKIVHSVPKGVRIVTIMGDIYYSDGPLRTGKLTTPGILSRKRSINELKEGLTAISSKLIKLNEKLETLDREYKDYDNALEECNSIYSKTEQEMSKYHNKEKGILWNIDSLKQKKDIQIKHNSSLQSDLSSIKTKMEDNSQLITDLERNIHEKEGFIKERESLLSQIKMDEFLDKVTYWSSQVAVTETSFNDLTIRGDEYANQLSNREIQFYELQKKVEVFESTLSEIKNKKDELRAQETKISDALENLQSLIEPAETELENSEKEEELVREKESNNQVLLAKVERYYNQVQMDFERKQEAVDILHQKIEDDFGLVDFDYAVNVDGPVPLPFEGLVEQLVTIDILPPDMEENLSRQRLLLRRLGPVNPEAQEEYNSVLERHSFLETQLEDLKKAVVDTQQVIAELDEITRQEFLKTFNEVAGEFKSIFHRLFGGGSARLLLTDPENLTDTGIDIEARLPGRKEQGLALLSGGERSLTAIALIFSLLKVSPTPVCVLDEVDAMLDEANVARFRDLLEELSLDTQFIVITHNRNTVQAADIIYGVTMGSDSVSQAISLKLDQVSEELLTGK